MNLIFTHFLKFNFWNINLKEIYFSNFWKMQKNAIFIYQKINFFELYFPYTDFEYYFHFKIDFYFKFLMLLFDFHFHK